MTSEAEKLIGASIVAKRLGVPRHTVYDWMRGPRPLPHYSVGTRGKRFRWTEVEAWLERARVAL